MSRRAALLLFLFFLSYMPLCLLDALPLEVNVSAQCAILMNAHTGAILYEKNSTQRAYPASITKIATALYALEKVRDFSQMALVSSESLKSKPGRSDWESLPSYWLEWDGKKMGLVKGESLSLETLLYGVLLVSGNDAANVLAEAVSGSIPAFMQELNQYLSELGCKNTAFKNPHGLFHKEHYTTAYEMALFAQRALQIPKVTEITTTLEYQKPRTNKQPSEILQQNNQLLRPKSRFFYPKAIGLKTGYTKLAQHTLVAAAQDQGRTLIAVLLGCEKRDSRYLDAKKLFEAAFSQKKVRRLFFEKNQAYSKEIEGARTSLIGALAKDAAVEFYPAEEPEVKAYLYWQVPALPIAKGEKVGEMRFFDARQNLLFTTPLIAKQQVQATLSHVIKQWVSKLFSKSKASPREIAPQASNEKMGR